METRHIKIDYEDSLTGKKQLLSFEINILHILKKIKSYRLLRSKELNLKNQLRIQLNNLKKRINLAYSLLPHENIGIQKRIDGKKKITSAGPDIQDELEEIKRKLKALR